MSNLFSFQKASHRKTECYWLDIFGVRVLISYQTPVAFTTHDGCHSYRQSNHWGPTTGRHMKSDTSVWRYDVIENEDEFEARLDRAILEAVATDKKIVHALVSNAVTDKLTEVA